MYEEGKRRRDKKLQQYFLIAALVGLLPFLYFAIVGYAGWTNVTVQDYKISAFFYNLHNPVRNFIATWVTHLADRIAQTAVTVLVVVVLFIFRKWRTALWYGLTVLLGADYLNSFVKDIYQRVRPDQIEPLVEIDGYAFPSGHSMGAMIVYGGLLFLTLRLLKRKSARWLLGVLTGVLILVIGLSRIYLAVHYPSDVIGGFSLGFSWLCLSIALFGLKFTRQEFRPRNRYSLRKRGFRRGG